MLLIPEDSVTIQTHPRRGRSLVLSRDIDAGTVIGDYQGEFKSVADELALDEKYGFYSMDYDGNFIIFPTQEERNSKDIPLINHSCEENCGIISYKNHALYYALRKLFKGEELTVCYSISPDDTMSHMAKYQCHCGSDFCRGTFCVSEGELEASESFESGLAGGDEPGETPVLNAHLNRLPQYPDTIPDYVEFDIYGSQNAEPVILESDALLPIKKLRMMIRETGKRLHFKNLHQVVRGIRRNIILTEYYQ